MIAYLKGTVLEASPLELILDVQESDILSKYQSQLLKKYHLLVKIANYTSILFTEKTVLPFTDFSQKAIETSSA